MTTITYEDAQNYYDKHEGNIRRLLQGLEERIIHGRDKAHIPVYLTKQRVKSVNSIYLKTKRKARGSLDELTDIGGLRILCLFEQDILGVHAYLTKILKESGFKLIEFKIYNWTRDQVIEQLEHIVGRHFPGHVFEDAIRESGYKSIHYVVTCTYNAFQYFVEIQLRTLLQDVWGELEHALAYKQGNIHPHIKDSFRLLSKDLQNNDELISQLRNIRDKEFCVSVFALEDVGPAEVFTYEPELVPMIFTRNGTVGNAYREYSEHIYTWRAHVGDRKKWAEDGWRLYNGIDRLVKEYDDRNEINYQYWLAMEKSFLLFVEAHHNEALKIYEHVGSNWKEAYVPHFRIGEILYIKGEIEKALVALDKSEELMLKQTNCNLLNAYTLEATLALLYWLMGEEYYGIALEKILKAEEYYNKNDGILPQHIKHLLMNNLCWYYLENYILAKKKYERTQTAQDLKAQGELYEKALDRFRGLEVSLETGQERRANDYDTAAWFSFNAFLETKDQTFLEKAKKYCKEGWGLKSHAPLHAIHSSNLYRNHTQEILSTEL